MNLYEHSSCSWKFSLLCRIRQAVKAVSARLHNWVWQSVNTNLHGKSWYENMLEKIFPATVFLWDFDLQQYETCWAHGLALLCLSWKPSKPWEPGVLSRWNLRHHWILFLLQFTPFKSFFYSKNSKNKVPQLLFRQGFSSHQIFDFHTAHISPMIILHMKGIFGIKSCLQRPNL